MPLPEPPISSCPQCNSTSVETIACTDRYRKLDDFTLADHSEYDVLCRDCGVVTQLRDGQRPMNVMTMDELRVWGEAVREKARNMAAEAREMAREGRKCFSGRRGDTARTRRRGMGSLPSTRG